MVKEIRDFATIELMSDEPTRVLTTVVSATVGSRRAASIVPQLIDRFGGRLVVAGRGRICATFDGAGRAVRCAAAIVANGVREGWGASAGLHSGECELHPDGGVDGVALQVAGAIADMAGPGDVLVSQTVRDVVVGTTITFEAIAILTLEGVPGTWEVLQVTGT
jgi:class 3 adenylate cyclase